MWSVKFKWSAQNHLLWRIPFLLWVCSLKLKLLSTCFLFPSFFFWSFCAFFSIFCFFLSFFFLFLFLSFLSFLTFTKAFYLFLYFLNSQISILFQILTSVLFFSATLLLPYLSLSIFNLDLYIFYLSFLPHITFDFLTFFYFDTFLMCTSSFNLRSISFLLFLFWWLVCFPFICF